MTGAEARLTGASAHADEGLLRRLFSLMLGEAEGEYTPLQAAWALTHLPRAADGAIADRRGALVDLAIATPDASLRRLTLALLERLVWSEDEANAPFLDFCLLHLADPAEAVGIRALCVKLAYAQCRHWPELRAELRQQLLLMEAEALKPGLAHTRKKTLQMLQ